MHQPCAWRVVGHSLEGVPDKLVKGVPANGSKVLLHAFIPQQVLPALLPGGT